MDDRRTDNVSARVCVTLRRTLVSTGEADFSLTEGSLLYEWVKRLMRVTGTPSHPHLSLGLIFWHLCDIARPFSFTIHW